MNPMQKIAHHLILNKTDYFSDAAKFVELQELFVVDSIFDKAQLWLNMLIYPLLTVISVLFYGSEASIFSVFEFYKCATLWSQWFQFRELVQRVSKWSKLVHFIGGPFISTNDARYHVFIYADGMQRLENSIFLLPGRDVGANVW